jgi:hypothetical protein
MGWQTGVVLCAVAASGGYLAWSVWRFLTGRKSGCAGGCSCAGKSPVTQPGVSFVSPEQLRLRPRASREDPRIVSGDGAGERTE